MSFGAHIVGVGLTEQTRFSERSTISLCIEAARAAIDDAGIERDEIDGIAGRWPGPGGTVFFPGSADWAGALRLPLRWIGDTYPQGVPALLDAAAAIHAGLCSTVLIVGGQASAAVGAAVASYTRPENEFVRPWGSHTAAQFALVAQRYFHQVPEARQVTAEVAASIRNLGHVNPEAVMYGRGPYTSDDILSAPPIAEPFTRLDLCLANDGAAAVVVTGAERARDVRSLPIEVLGGGAEWFSQQYVNPPRWDEVGMIGADVAQRMFATAGLTPADVDVAELYDANSFEVIRQLEALGFCGFGEAPAFVRSTGIGPQDGLPVNTDGGLLSFSHLGWSGPTLKLIQAVRQLRGEVAVGRQVPGARVALCTGAGSGAQYFNAALLGRS